MNILVIGGTRFFGVYTVKQLIQYGHKVTIATRGLSKENFDNQVSHITLNRCDEKNIKEMLIGHSYDVVIDKIAYCSNDIRRLLDTIQPKKYILMSSTAVYNPKIWNTKESDFDPLQKELIWCERSDSDYSEVKRQAECALYQKYGQNDSVAVRYPYVIGEDDYTNRLLFYVEHVVHEVPMYIDNIDCQMSFIDSKEAGEFMAYLCETNYKGAINGAMKGTVSPRDIVSYLENKTGKKAIIKKNGDSAPYNGEVEYSINTDKALKLGYKFQPIERYIYDLLDFYISKCL